MNKKGLAPVIWLALIPIVGVLAKWLIGGITIYALFQDPLIKITVVMVVIIYLFKKVF